MRVLQATLHLIETALLIFEGRSHYTVTLHKFLAGDVLSFPLPHGTSTSSPTTLPTSFPLRQQNILQHNARLGD